MTPRKYIRTQQYNNCIYIQLYGLGSIGSPHPSSPIYIFVGCHNSKPETTKQIEISLPFQTLLQIIWENIEQRDTTLVWICTVHVNNSSPTFFCFRLSSKAVLVRVWWAFPYEKKNTFHTIHQESSGRTRKNTSPKVFFVLFRWKGEFLPSQKMSLSLSLFSLYILGAYWNK